MIHSLQIYPYKLSTQRSGVLLKVHFEKGTVGKAVGYADLHPWTEWSEPSCQELLCIKSLQDSVHPLLHRAFELAEWDCEARLQKEDLLLEAEEIPQNFLIVNCSDWSAVEAQILNLQLSAPAVIKVKMPFFNRVYNSANKNAFSENFANFCRQKRIQLRLDFNSQWTFSQLQQWLITLSDSQKSLIAYLEDPCPWDQHQWQILQLQIPLAIDWELKNIQNEQDLEKAVSVLVIKPARQSLHEWIEKAQKLSKKITVTSVMDHPVGVVTAWAQANFLFQKYPDLFLPAGCGTFTLYPESSFSQQLQWKNGWISYQAHGVGLGFEQQLESLPWLSKF